MQQPLVPRPAPRKTSGNGCLIALAVVGGLTAVTVALVAFALYRFAGTKEGKVVFGVIGDAARLVAEAHRAPGTKEVRALGCDQAMAFDMDSASTLMKHLDASAPPASMGIKMVVCQAGFFGRAPSCEAVAHAYLGAARAPARELLVTVSQGGRGAVCSSAYDPSGTKLRDLDADSTPRVPGEE
jgi:hypothetical protein